MCYHRGATTVAEWLGLGQQWVCLRASWHWLYQTWGKLLAASHRSRPYSSPATKTSPRKPITPRYYFYCRRMNCIPVGPFQASSKHGGKDELCHVDKNAAISFFLKIFFFCYIPELFRCPDLLPSSHFSGLVGWVNARAGFAPHALQVWSCGLE